MAKSDRVRDPPPRSPCARRTVPPPPAAPRSARLARMVDDRRAAPEVIGPDRAEGCRHGGTPASHHSLPLGVSPVSRVRPCLVKSPAAILTHRQSSHQIEHNVPFFETNPRNGDNLEETPFIRSCARAHRLRLRRGRRRDRRLRPGQPLVGGRAPQGRAARSRPRDSSPGSTFPSATGRRWFTRP